METRTRQADAQRHLRVAALQVVRDRLVHHARHLYASPRQSVFTDDHGGEVRRILGVLQKVAKQTTGLALVAGCLRGGSQAYSPPNTGPF